MYNQAGGSFCMPLVQIRFARDNLSPTSSRHDGPATRSAMMLGLTYALGSHPSAKMLGLTYALGGQPLQCCGSHVLLVAQETSAPLLQ